MSILKNWEFFILQVFAGYWFLTRTTVSNWSIELDSGYHVLFKSAIAGYLLGILTKLLFVPFASNPFDESMNLLIDFEASPIEILILFILAFLLPLGIKSFVSQEKWFRKHLNKRGSPIERKIYQASLTKTPLQNYRQGYYKSTI